jgi:hypothetical protein
MAISSVRPDATGDCGRAPAIQVEHRRASACAFDMYQSCAGAPGTVRTPYHGVQSHGLASMVYQCLAALVLLLHLGFILFVVAGAALVVRRRRLLPLHLAAVAWGVAIEVTGAACPLTALENRLRLLAGTAGYAGGFVDHYLVGLVYPAGLTRGMQWLLAAAVLALNALLYVRILRRARFDRR